MASYAQIPIQSSPVMQQTPPIGYSNSGVMSPGPNQPLVSSPLNPNGPASSASSMRDRDDADTSEGSSSRPSINTDAASFSQRDPSSGSNSSYGGGALQSPPLLLPSGGAFPNPPFMQASRESSMSVTSLQDSIRAFQSSLGGNDYSRYSFVASGGSPNQPSTPTGAETPTAYFGSESSDNVYGMNSSSSHAGLLAPGSLGQPHMRQSYASSLYGEGLHSRYSTVGGESMPKVDDSDLLWDPKNVEADDYLHNPDAGGDKSRFVWTSSRGWFNAIALAFLLIAMLMVFLALPILLLSEIPDHPTPT